jgi:hypothetical protein
LSFNRYNGTKARFGSEKETIVLECFNHAVSDFTGSAAEARLSIKRIEEFFDDNDRSTIPRMLSLVFKKE